MRGVRRAGGEENNQVCLPSVQLGTELLTRRGQGLLCGYMTMARPGIVG